MRVGILTYHWVSNFGANLQALSTYKYLERKGYNPIIINWIPLDLQQYYQQTVSESQNKEHEIFALENYTAVSEICRTDEEVASVVNKMAIDYIVVGSDAVFSIKPYLSRFHLGRKGLIYIKPYSDGCIPNPFWGSFLNKVSHDVKIVSLSASAQNAPYKKMIFPRERKQYYNALSRFSRLTVRDIWTQKMLRYISNDKIIPKITPDPVFAFEYNVSPKSREFVKKRLGVDAKYVLLSVPSTVKDVSWIKELEQLFAEKNIIVVGLSVTTAKFDSPLKYNLSFPINPLDWYDAIKYSEGYIGELMHPVLVSLHNAVPVYAFDTYGFTRFGRLNEESSKVYQIMKRFNLIETNYYNRYYNEKPSPQKVFDSICSFDRMCVKDESEKMYGEYVEMMNYILEA